MMGEGRWRWEDRQRWWSHKWPHLSSRLPHRSREERLCVVFFNLREKLFTHRLSLPSLPFIDIEFSSSRKGQDVRYVWFGWFCLGFLVSCLSASDIEKTWHDVTWLFSRSTFLLHQTLFWHVVVVSPLSCQRDDDYQTVILTWLVFFSSLSSWEMCRFFSCDTFSFLPLSSLPEREIVVPFFAYFFLLILIHCPDRNLLCRGRCQWLILRETGQRKFSSETLLFLERQTKSPHPFPPFRKETSDVVCRSSCLRFKSLREFSRESTTDTDTQISHLDALSREKATSLTIVSSRRGGERDDS